MLIPTAKQRMKAAKILMMQPETKFETIDLNKTEHPTWMTRCFKNNRYVVMVADNADVSTGIAIRIMVQRHDNMPIPKHWSEMQRIKNTLFGKETTAIEYYPAESVKTDVANIYWMWIFPEGVLPLPIKPS